jgi:hypothetical protein
MAMDVSSFVHPRAALCENSMVLKTVHPGYIPLVGKKFQDNDSYNSECYPLIARSLMCLPIVLVLGGGSLLGMICCSIGGNGKRAEESWFLASSVVSYGKESLCFCQCPVEYVKTP